MLFQISRQVVYNLPRHSNRGKQDRKHLVFLFIPKNVTPRDQGQIKENHQKTSEKQNSVHSFEKTKDVKKEILYIPPQYFFIPTRQNSPRKNAQRYFSVSFFLISF